MVQIPVLGPSSDKARRHSVGGKPLGREARVAGERLIVCLGESAIHPLQQVRPAALQSQQGARGSGTVRPGKRAAIVHGGGSDAQTNSFHRLISAIRDVARFGLIW